MNGNGAAGHYEDVSGPRISRRMHGGRMPALARPGQVAYVVDENGGCEILTVTASHCICRKEDGEVIAPTWDEVSLDDVRPDPAFTAPAGAVAPGEPGVTEAHRVARRVAALLAWAEIRAGSDDARNKSEYESIRQSLQQVYGDLWSIAEMEERDTFAHVNDPADEPAEQAAA